MHFPSARFHTRQHRSDLSPHVIELPPFLPGPPFGSGRPPACSLVPPRFLVKENGQSCDPSLCSMRLLINGHHRSPNLIATPAFSHCSDHKTPCSQMFCESLNSTPNPIPILPLLPLNQIGQNRHRKGNDHSHHLTWVTGLDIVRGESCVHHHSPDHNHCRGRSPMISHIELCGDQFSRPFGSSIFMLEVSISTHTTA